MAEDGISSIGGTYITWKNSFVTCLTNVLIGNRQSGALYEHEFAASTATIEDPHFISMGALTHTAFLS